MAMYQFYLISMKPFNKENMNNTFDLLVFNFSKFFLINLKTFVDKEI